MTGVLAAVRLFVPVCPAAALEAVGVISLVTAIYTAALAVVQTDARRFIASLCIGNTALVLTGISLGTEIGMTAALTLWISGGITLTGTAFALRAAESRIGEIKFVEFLGLYERAPALAVCFLIAGLGVVGFPGTIGFLPLEVLIERAMAVSPVMGAGMVITIALNGFAVVRAYALVFTGTRHSSAISAGSDPARTVHRLGAGSAHTRGRSSATGVARFAAAGRPVVAGTARSTRTRGPDRSRPPAVNNADLASRDPGRASSVFDARIRRTLDPLLDTAGALLSRAGLSANAVTVLGFLFGCGAWIALADRQYPVALALIALNRLSDGLDGAIARRLGPTDLGGYLDITLDFVFYAGVPFFFAVGRPEFALAAAFLVVQFRRNRFVVSGLLGDCRQARPRIRNARDEVHLLPGRAD